MQKKYTVRNTREKINEKTNEFFSPNARINFETISIRINESKNDFETNFETTKKTVRKYECIVYIVLYECIVYMYERTVCMKLFI